MQDEGAHGEFAESALDEGKEDEEWVLKEEVQDRKELLEHIAGKGCTSSRGYSGWRISVEEMRNHSTWQSVVLKSTMISNTEPFTPSPSDEEFEIRGKWFLSGLQDHMPDAEYFTNVFPVRHGMVSPNPYIIVVDDGCVPFHPWCLEIWKKRSGGDIEGLMRWFDCYVRHGIELTRSELVYRLQQQYWDHEVGTEWVVANPLFVPGLGDVLKGAAVDEDDNFDALNGAFEVDAKEISDAAEDCFANLPMEVRLLVLSDLSSKDIASLRLASRTFRQLPIVLWHELIAKEMPWLWEVWTEPKPLPYWFWATVNEAELRANPSMQKEDVSIPNVLPLGRVNWFQLYANIKRKWSSLKGIQNRRRIWTDCGEIMRCVEKSWTNSDVSGHV